MNRGKSYLIKAVCFDFDGTLVDSNNVKKSVFLDLASNFPDGRIFMETLLYHNPPLDRFAVFKLLSEKYGLSEEHNNNLLAEFTATVHQRIVEASLMPGVLHCLNDLTNKKILLSINSATPEPELNAILLEMGLSRWFHEIKGRPASKSENLDALLANQGLKPSEVLIVGDGADDQDYADLAGCHFQPVFSFRGTSTVSHRTLDSLKKLHLASFNGS
jgi:phosphoglycolate phosphatase-like HAD superfamily hydrolase